MKRFLFSQPVGKGVRGIVLLAMLALNFGYGGVSVVRAAPPAHDDFDDATVINAIEFHDEVDTREATPTDDIPNVDDPANFMCDGTNHLAGFASVWYKYTPPETQSLSLNTIGTETYDTFIAVWTGSRGNLNLRACNDETSEGFSELSFVANGGTTYFIEVAQFNDGTSGSHDIGGDLFFNAYITNTNVTIGGTIRGRYFIPETGGLRRSFIRLTAGPVEVENVAGNPIIVSERVIQEANNIDTSFSEMMGLPQNQLDVSYWFPWYNSKNLDTQLRIANISPGTASIQVRIAGQTRSSFTLATGESRRVTIPNVDSGPVRVLSDRPIIAAERVIHKINNIPISFTEMMGLPQKALDTIYWMPWYNSKNLDTQLRIANVSVGTAQVQIRIGGQLKATINIPQGKSQRVTIPNVDNGPVRISSDRLIVAAERVIYKVNNVPVSFTEMMGIPNSQLDTIYWLPRYNSKDFDSQLRIANVSSNPTPANVQVFIGGLLRTTISLPQGKSQRVTIPNVDSGPVKIVSTVNIVAAERVIYRVNNRPTSFSELMGMPNILLDSVYWMPWYNNKELDTQLRFSLP